MTARLALLLAAACTGGPSSPPQAPQPPAPPAAPTPPGGPNRPALVVLVVVDQLGQGHLDRFEGRFTAGLARLTGPQAWVGVAEHATLATETCPGHATLATGASPAKHGIVGNGFIVDGRQTYCLDAGPLPVDSLGDVTARMGGAVVAVAIKDRSAVLFGGAEPTLAAWLNRKTSVEQHGSTAQPRALEPPLVPRATWIGWLNEPWTLSDPSLATAFPFPDIQPHEDDHGLGAGFPKTPAAQVLEPRALANGLVMTPAGGDYTTQAGLEAVRRYGLGQDAVPDLLTLSYSHFDGVGHSYTPASLEAVDALARLDHQLGALMDGLDAQVGAGRWSLVLSADHGAPMEAPTYVDLRPVVAAVTEGLDAAGLPPLAHPAGLGLHLDPNLTAEQRAQTVAVAQAAVDAAPGLMAVLDYADPQGPFAEDMRNTRVPGRTPDLVLLLSPGHVPIYRGKSKGTSHGTPHDYDQLVPLLATGKGVKPGQGRRVDARQVAPTVARLLGAPALDGAELGPVSQALVEPGR